MSCNPILEEIYAARDKLLADYHGDVSAYIRDARERALASGRPIASPTPRTNRSKQTAKSGVAAVQGQSSPPDDR